MFFLPAHQTTMPLLKLLSCLLCGSFLFACSATVPPQPFEQPVTGVYGQALLASGEPASGGWIFAYRSPQGNFRGPADYAGRVEEDGGYVLDLLPGRWYLVGRYRQQGSLDGPPKAGDAWAIHPGNPVLVEAEQPHRLDFRLLGVSQPMLLRGGSLASGTTGFRGRLIDPQGQPVAGAFALAYRDRNFRRMPDHTSAVVGESGRFILYVPQAGRYCLAARQKTRGQPVQGEPYGLLGQGEQGCRTVAEGEILDVGEIRLSPYLR